jgi:predicted MPP superfamily phosphohydrolase
MPEEKKFTRRYFLKLALGSFLSTTVIGAAGYKYAVDIETTWLKIESVKLRLPNLRKAFHGYRIAQISDIHIDSWHTMEHLDHVITTVNQIEPDCTVITGDFFSENPQNHYARSVKSLGRLQARDGVLAVLGNHDHWTNASVTREILKDSYIQDISNAVLTIKRDRNQLHIAGVDDYWERQDDLDHVVAALPKTGCAILLAHEPDFADISAATGRFDLQISGHSHGGQVVIPVIGPPILPRYAEKYSIGLYKVQDMLLYVNRGVGTIYPHVRFNCRPEITIFTLIAET